MRSKTVILLALLLAAFILNLDTTMVNVALPTLVRDLHATNSQLQWVVDAYNLVFGVTAADRRQLVGPVRPQKHADRRARRLRGGQHHRRVHRQPSRAHHGTRGDGPRRRHELSRHTLADHKYLHRTQGAGAGDRPLGSNCRGGHRPRADRGRVAPGALQLAEHLLRNGTGRRCGSGPGRCQHPGIGEVRPGSPRPAGPGSVRCRDGTGGVHHHRGPRLRVGICAQCCGIHGLRHPVRHVRALGTTRGVPDARCAALPQHALQCRQRVGN